MASKRKKVSSRRSVNPNADAWHDFLIGARAKNLAIAAAAVAALLYLNDSVFEPVYTSGPPPFPSRAEVDQVRDSLTMGLDSVQKNLDETLETAKAARQEAQQAVAKADSNRLQRLLALKTELEAKMRAAPDDKIIAQVLAQTNIDIAKLSAEASLVVQ